MLLLILVVITYVCNCIQFVQYFLPFIANKHQLNCRKHCQKICFYWCLFTINIAKNIDQKHNHLIKFGFARIDIVEEDTLSFQMVFLSTGTADPLDSVMCYWTFEFF